MEVGGARWGLVGGVHVVPVNGAEGRLHLCGLGAVGPEPDALLDHVDATTLVCLQTDDEIAERFPRYLDWLAAPGDFDVLRVQTDDYLVAGDEEVIALVTEVYDRLVDKQNVVVHCGAGWGRAGTLAVLIMCAGGSDIDAAIDDLRAARPAAGPQSVAQDMQVARLAPRLIN